MEIPLQDIDRAIGLGANVADWPEVKAARAAQERLGQLALDRQRITDTVPSARITAVVQQYADGKITAEEMTVAVANINAGADRAIANQLFDQAAVMVAEPHKVTLRRLGDRWIEALRPVATQRAKHFAHVAARLPNNLFHERDVDPLEWRNLGRALDAWNELLTLAESLGARPERWLHPERQPNGLIHSPQTSRSVAVVMHHAGCGAGVWTRAEVRAAAPPLRPAEHADLPPAA
jgi:hypothetical protein